MSHSTHQDPYGQGQQQPYGNQPGYGTPGGPQTTAGHGDGYGDGYGQQQAPAGFGQQPPPPQRRMRNGLGTAALILGIIGTITGLIPLLFWLGGTLGLIALILGLSGRGRVKRGEAGNKKTATFGALLGLVAMVVGVIGAVITFKAVDDAVDEIDKAATGVTATKEPGSDDGSKSGTSKNKGNKGKKGKGKGAGGGSGDSGGASALAAGDTASYPDGLKITTAAPQPYTPDEYAAGHTRGNKAYLVKVTVENTGAEKFDSALLMAQARAGAEGVTAEEIFDDTVGGGMTGTLMPGKKATVSYAFDTPPTAKDLTVEITPGFEHDASQWELAL
ncbi:DUF4352 domain-containing protein [Streptomyces yaizuensis]|uniref:DUF4190 and DUF4352 domain-containing protein n=1 Tax=Streptomyces yaizuensis TaxID=2989713 RepID=A0ABQ5P9S8_9ACTN|nr:DUF4352 domain-containing protein [Streptomyces sp. YSPA8]GLF99346.1 DUF4190 and DUF4352 domain-containing protein [Streptomyces sp. YSPA8]